MISATATPSSSALWASIGPAIDVADGVDAVDRGAEMGVDDDAAALVALDADLVEAEALGVGPPADGDQHDVGVERLAVAARRRLDRDLERLAACCRPTATLLDSWKVMPCLARMRCACLPTSPSMPGRMRSRNSTTVTSEPSRRQTEPSSRPITPAPTTISCFGTSAAPARRSR